MANVTSSGNTNIKPRINTAKFMGSSYAAGSFLENEIKNINLRLSSLAVDIRKNLASITSITEILNSHSHIDESDGSTINENDSKLNEISDILLDIGNAMSLDFANRIAENQEDISNLRKQKSKEKFGRAEGKIEKQKKQKVTGAGNIFTKTASKASSPFTGIFSKLLSLGGILGTGIVSNAVFDWFKDEENQKKMSKFFNIMVKNWKWIVGTIGVLVTAKIIADMIALINGLGLLGGLLTGKGLLGKAFLAFMLFGATKALPDGGQGLGRIESRILSELLNMPGGATKENRDILIERLKDERSEIGPIDIFSRKSEIDNQIRFLELGELSRSYAGNEIIKKFDFEKLEIIPIDKIEPIKKENKISDLNKKSNLNFIPINFPTIDNKLILSSSSVATEVLNISSKNVSDPYRKLSPDYYGIYV